MKKICYLIGSALLFSAGLNAQSVYDVTTFSNSDLNGTARFIGMGGAMGALGGDISTMSTNPAGIGVYRSNDLMVTFGTTNNVSKASFGNSSLSEDHNHGTFDNFGFVYSKRVGSQNDVVQFVNFGFNYRRSKQLYGNLTTSQSLNNTSQTEQIGDMASSGGTPAAGKENGYFSFDNGDISWLTVMGQRNGVINYNATDGTYHANSILSSNYSLVNNFHSRERGGIDAFDLNGAINLRDRIYLGLTLSLYDVDYSKYTGYQESFDQSKYYNVQSWNKYTGSGWDLKLGAIIRPIEESSFRIGLAIHTPTFYNLTNTTSTRMESNLSSTDTYVDSQEDMVSLGADPDVDFDYKLRTPWVYNGSLGYIVGKNLALGAEYEYRDYSSAKIYDNDGNDMMISQNSTFNDMVGSMLKGVSTYRFGAEYKVIPEFALRLGYNYTSAAYTHDAYKQLTYNSINTDTDYSNTKQTNNFSFGFGYRGRNLYADFAYLYTHYNADFHPFADPDAKYADANLSSVKNDIHNFKITLGYRF